MVEEGGRPQIEGVEPTKEEAPPTPPKVEPTLKYTEEDFQRAVSRGLESTTKQLSLRDARAKAAEAEVEHYKLDLSAIQVELQDLQKMHDELVSKQFAEDPDAMKAYKDRRAIAEERRQLAKEKAEIEAKLYDAEKLAWATSLTRKAGELVKETGIDLAELEECQTEEEMEVKALRHQLSKGTIKEPEKESAKSKFDSGITSGGGINLNEMSPREQIIYGLTHKKK